MSFKENLKAELEFQGMIVKELAARTNISKRTLDTYLDCREVLPNVVAAVKIAQALGGSVEYLVNGNENYPPAQHIHSIKFKNVVDDLMIVPKEVFLPIRAAIKIAADAERKKICQTVENAGAD